MPLPSDHTYSPPTHGARRSPCPALNALANHGYLPRDGRSITVVQLVRTLVGVYNLSIPLAVTLSVFGVILCGNWWSLDLHQLAKHGRIEHDGSLVHDDTDPDKTFAPTAVDPELVRKLFAITPAPALTLRDFAKARARRDRSMLAPLDRVHAEIARGEAALTIQAFSSMCNHVGGHADDSEPGSEGAICKAYLEQWLLEERLPDGWERPKAPIGLVGTARRSRKIAKMIQESRTT
ncbi:Cloroperoxidase [Daedalea quercina L-15889]|uniref:Cloroperoxidase n=1 Tax=Daedalea quercina L-15889 TaxID=1314783 RepID=A0A165STI4_9APHY|nr:Cloroperoxidase [Daedalea quercina L-15889]